MRKFSLNILAALLAFALAGQHVQAAGRLQDTGDKIVIVIDPGHGGTNRGTIENGHEEKFMTMTTALAMYEELLLYDNVEVYLTRTDDITLSLEERAKFAKSVDADFMFSIHYNASENHELYGSEVWVSAFAPYNGYGYQFGYEFLADMREQGLLVRGVKTRLGSKGDYYGIIREAVALEVPAVIIEHCHVDEAHDEGYCDEEEELEAFGRADATAVAKYFGLKSSVLNVDYSDYQLVEASGDSIVAVTQIDSTAPDFCELQLLDIDYENSILSFMVYAADYDSTLLYYSYSVDGGMTFSAREAWPDNDTLTGSYADSFVWELPIQEGTKPDVVLRAYNLYDLYTESNHYISQETFPVSPSAGNESASGTAHAEPSAAGSEAAYIDNGEAAQGEVVPVNAGVLEQGTESGKGVDAVNLLMICLCAVCVLFIMLAVLQGMAYYKHQKERKNQ